MTWSTWSPCQGDLGGGEDGDEDDKDDDDQQGCISCGILVSGI